MTLLDFLQLTVKLKTFRGLKKRLGDLFQKLIKTDNHKGLFPRHFQIAYLEGMEETINLSIFFTLLAIV